MMSIYLLKATCYFTVTELIFVFFKLNVSVIANSFTYFIKIR